MLTPPPTQTQTLPLSWFTRLGFKKIHHIRAGMIFSPNKLNGIKTEAKGSKISLIWSWIANEIKLSKTETSFQPKNKKNLTYAICWLLFKYMLKPGQKNQKPSLKLFLLVWRLRLAKIVSCVYCRKKRTKSCTYTRRLSIQSPDVNLHTFLIIFIPVN